MGQEYTRRIITLGALPLASTILYHNTFEHLLDLSQIGGEGDSVFELDPSLAFAGAHSAIMVTRTTGAANFDSIIARLESYAPASGQITYAVRFRSPNFGILGKLELKLSWSNSAVDYFAVLRFDNSDDTLQYDDDSGTPVVLSNLGFDLRSNQWHYLRLTVDFLNHYYVSAAFDSHLFDLSGIPLEPNPNVTQPVLLCDLEITTNSANAVTINLDELTLLDGRQS